MTLHFANFKNCLIDILKTYNGNFVTAYHVCEQLKLDYPSEWKTLSTAYPSAPGLPEVGAGAGKYFSQATFISRAFDNFRENGEKNIKKEWFGCEGVTFSDVTPGYPTIVAIWAWQ